MDMQKAKKEDIVKNSEEQNTMTFEQKADLDNELTFIAADADKARLMIVDLLSDHFEKDDPTDDTLRGISYEYQRIRTKLEIAEDFLLQISKRAETMTDCLVKVFTR